MGKFRCKLTYLQSMYLFFKDCPQSKVGSKAIYRYNINVHGRVKMSLDCFRKMK